MSVDSRNPRPSALPTESDTPAKVTGWVTHPRALGWLLVICGSVGLAAAFELSVDKFRKLKNPDVVLSCDINPFFSCGTVMEHWQSELFGFPNQFLGLIAFVIPILLGVLLISGTPLPRWILLGLNVGLAAGMVFVLFMFYSSIYAIGVGCPWCMVVWLATIPMFVATTAHNIKRGHYGQGIRTHIVTQTLAGAPGLLSAFIVFLIAGAIVVQFWQYFQSLLT